MSMILPSKSDNFKIRRMYAFISFLQIWVVLAAIIFAAIFGFPLADYMAILIAIIGADTTIIGYYFTTTHFNKQIPKP